MPEDPTNHDRPVTPLGRTADSILRRRWPEFFVEFILIIVGILAALAIDGWMQDQRDRVNEIAYLQLLNGDLGLIADQLQRYTDFETANMDSGAAAYLTLTEDKLPPDHNDIQAKLTLMGGRRTLQLESAAYSDLQSTGNLQLISNQYLRQRIVRYFAALERIELVLEKNNTAFIDRLFNPFLLEIGVTIGIENSNESNVNAANDLVRDRLGSQVRFEPDDILLSPADAEVWDDIRRQVLFRTRISSIGVTLGNAAVELTNELTAEIEQELARRDTG